MKKGVLTNLAKFTGNTCARLKLQASAWNFLKDRKSTLKLNSSAYKKYEYGHFGRWYIKLTLFKRF